MRLFSIVVLYKGDPTAHILKVQALIIVAMLSKFKASLTLLLVGTYSCKDGGGGSRPLEIGLETLFLIYKPGFTHKFKIFKDPWILFDLDQLTILFDFFSNPHRDIYLYPNISK